MPFDVERFASSLGAGLKQTADVYASYLLEKKRTEEEHALNMKEFQEKTDIQKKVQEDFEKYKADLQWTYFQKEKQITAQVELLGLDPDSIMWIQNLGKTDPVRALIINATVMKLKGGTPLHKNEKQSILSALIGAPPTTQNMLMKQISDTEMLREERDLKTRQVEAQISFSKTHEIYYKLLGLAAMQKQPIGLEDINTLQKTSIFYNTEMEKIKGSMSFINTMNKITNKQQLNPREQEQFASDMRLINGYEVGIATVQSLLRVADSSNRLDSLQEPPPTEKKAPPTREEQLGQYMEIGRTKKSLQTEYGEEQVVQEKSVLVKKLGKEYKGAKVYDQRELERLVQGKNFGVLIYIKQGIGGSGIYKLVDAKQLRLIVQ